MLICIFHGFATSARIDTGGWERGGGGVGVFEQWMISSLLGLDQSYQPLFDPNVPKICIHSL